jgi:aldehyde dehydrogenase
MNVAMTNQGFVRTARPQFKPRYDNFIGGAFVPPAAGRYFENTSPVNGQVLCEIARSDATDVERALDAAHAAKDAWGRTSVSERALLLNRIADRMQDHLQAIAEAESWDNGKPIRETTAADVPLAIDHFRYFAGCIRAQEGGISEIDHDTVAYHFHEPLGDHTVELPAADGLLEARPGHCRRQLRGDQASRTNPGLADGLG